MDASRLESGPAPPREGIASVRPPREAADYNLRIIWALARYVEEQFGATALRDVAAAGGLQPSDFQDKNRWISWQGFEAVLAKARSLMESDDEFKLACVHRMKEAYGPLRYILWAVTPAQVFAQGSKQYRLVSSCGELLVPEHGRTWAHSSFKSSVPFSRLVCFVRHAQGSALPTMWGLPPAHLHETACVAWGDPTCEIRFHWYEGRRWLPVGVGGALFALLGFLLVRIGLAAVPTPLAMAAFGGLLGYILEGRRTERLNQHTREEVMGAFRQLAHE